MHPRLTARLLLITFSFFVSHGIANRFLKYCSPPGPHAPYAKGLKNSPLFKKTAKEELDTLLKSIATEADASVQYEMELGGKPIEDTLGGAHISIAITSPTETFYTFNYGAELQVPKTSHPEKVWTEHTIFRVASVSKALTVWEILKLGIDWNERVVDYLPELERGDYAAEWRELTVGALAGYVGGTVRDCMPATFISLFTFAN